MARKKRRPTPRAPLRRRKPYRELVAGEDVGKFLEAEAQPVEFQNLEAAEGDSGQRVPTFRSLVYSGGVMRPRVGGVPMGDWVVDLSGIRSESDSLPVHYYHDKEKPIGHTTGVEITPRRITASGALSVPSAEQAKVVDGARNEFPWKTSVGLALHRVIRLDAGETLTINGRQFRGPLMVARESTLGEISFVSVAGDAKSRATVTAQRSYDTETARMDAEFKSWLEAQGFEVDQLTETQIKTLEAAYQAESAGDDDAGPSGERQAPARNLEAGAGDGASAAGDGQAGSQGGQPDAAHLEAARAQLRRDLMADLDAEQNRRIEIGRLCAERGNPTIRIQGQDVSLEAHAIAERWTPERAELEAFRASAPRGPAVHSTGRARTQTLEALQGGMLLQAGVPLDSPHLSARGAEYMHVPAWLRAGVNDDTRQRHMEAAHRYDSAGLLELCAQAVEAETGERPLNKPALLEAAMSSGAVTALFSTTIGARALVSYREAPDSTREWTTEDDNPDLDAHDRPRMESLENLAYRPTGKDAEHAERSAVNEQTQVAGYAKQYQIDDDDLINDNLSLLRDTPAAMGRAAARLRPDLVYHIMLSAPTLSATSRALFNNTDGNLASLDLGTAGNLSTVIAKMAKVKEGDATLNLMPTHIVTGSELIDQAVQLVGSSVLSNDSGLGARNPIARYGITPVGEGRISNGVTHPKTGVAAAGSSTAWFLISTQGHTIVVTYLRGWGRVPRIRVSNLTQGKFGINVDARHYVGATPLDWKAMQQGNS